MPEKMGRKGLYKAAQYYILGLQVGSCLYSQASHLAKTRAPHGYCFKAEGSCCSMLEHFQREFYSYKGACACKAKKPIIEMGA